MLIGAFTAVGGLSWAAPALAATPLGQASTVAAPAAATPVHASSPTTTPTTPGTITFSGTRNNPAPYVPSAQPIYVPQPAVNTPPPASSATGSLPRYAAATAAQPGTSLAYTGRNTGALTAAGGAAVLAGLALVSLARRRPRAA